MRVLLAFICGLSSGSSLVARPPAPPVVILGGFGNADVDYKTPFNQPEEQGLVAALARRDVEATVMPLPRYDWLRVAGGLVDPLFWQCRQQPEGRAYGWYVRRARETIVETSKRNGGARVMVVGHSAGGWLARAVLGDGTWELEPPVPADSAEAAAAAPKEVVKAGDVVCGLVTLGAPHFPPPEDSPQPCATRGALAYCDKTYAGAHLLESEGIKYVTVAGAAITGSSAKPEDGDGAAASAFDPTLPARELLTNGGDGGGDGGGGGGGQKTDADALYAKRGEGSAARVAYTNYLALGGEGEGVVGDGVIPVSCAHLQGEGVEQITLEGVLHSINEAGTALPTERWYGSEKVLDRWWQPALEKVGC